MSSAEIIKREDGVVAQMTRGEVDMMVRTAKEFPRSVKQFQSDCLTMATVDQDTAASCFYVLPRGGKKIEGPSARLAEIAACCWGNIRTEARVVGEEGDSIVAQATCWDIERNNLIRIESRRRITDKNGNRYSDDMVIMTGNAATSVAFRNAVFKVVPFSYIKTVYEECRRVAVGEQRSLGDNVQRCLAYFSKAGVTEKQVLAYLNRNGVQDITLDDLADLRGITTALREGQTTVDQLFPPERLPEGRGGFGKKGQGVGQAQAKETQPGAAGEARVPSDEPPGPDQDDLPY